MRVLNDNPVRNFPIPFSLSPQTFQRLLSQNTVRILIIKITNWSKQMKTLAWRGVCGDPVIRTLEKAMAPHSSTPAWKIPWMEEPGRLQSMGSLRSETTERLHFHFSLSCLGEGNGNPLQCSCLENPWWATVYGVAQSQTRLKRLSSSSSRCRNGDTEVGNISSKTVITNKNLK